MSRHVLITALYISLAILFYVMLACAPAECIRNSDCGATDKCFENRCFFDCSATGWCPSGQYCVNSVCLDVECYKGICNDSGSASADSDTSAAADNDATEGSASDTEGTLDDSDKLTGEESQKDDDNYEIKTDSGILPGDSVVVHPVDSEFSDDDAVNHDSDVKLPDGIIIIDFTPSIDEDNAGTDNEASPDDDADTVDNETSDADCENGGILNDSDDLFNFGGMYDYNGTVKKTTASLGAIHPAASKFNYTAAITKQTDKTYSYDARLPGSIPYYSLKGIDLDAQFSDGDNKYSIYYTINYNESPTCSVSINVTQNGTGADTPYACGDYTTFTGTETYCYQFTGTGCSVSGCTSAFCPDECAVELDFVMEERH